MNRITLLLLVTWFACATAGSAEEPVLWFGGPSELVRAELSPDGVSATFQVSPFVDPSGMTPPPAGFLSLTELADGSLFGSISSDGSAPFVSRLFHVADPPTAGGPALLTWVGVMPEDIGIEGLYTDCDGRVYVMDTGIDALSVTGNRLLRFLGDPTTGDLRYEEVVDLSASVPDIDDLGPGIDDAGFVGDTPGFAIDTSRVHELDYRTGAFSPGVVSPGTFGIHALDRSAFTDDRSRLFVLSSSGALFEVDPLDASIPMNRLGRAGSARVSALTGALPDCVTGFCSPVEPRPRTQGFWKRQCRDPHPSGESGRLPEHVDDVSRTATFSDVLDALDLCERLHPNPAHSKCEQAEAQFMALLLNIASGRLTECNCVGDLVDESPATVGAVVAVLDELLSDPARSFRDCVLAQSVADALNRGEGLVPCPED